MWLYLYLTLGESTSKASTWSACMVALRKGTRSRVSLGPRAVSTWRAGDPTDRGRPIIKSPSRYVNSRNVRASRGINVHLSRPGIQFVSPLPLSAALRVVCLCASWLGEPTLQVFDLLADY